MSPERAREEKRKIRLQALSAPQDGPGWDELPQAFRDLVAQSILLQKRVERIDVALLEESGDPAPNPVNLQLRDLAAALRASPSEGV